MVPETAITEDEIAKWKIKIDEMPLMEMARLHRFAPSGHPIFDTSLPLYEQFKARFEDLGGFTPAISKQIGW